MSDELTLTCPEILVLGVYHMANPGRDMFNMQADDVLTPKRQAEIAQVLEVLKKFRPTKIAVQFGEPGDWAGADLVTAWWQRNLRICTHILQLIESPDERVLVIFGAGHLGWLRSFFASYPNLRLRKLAEFVD